MIIPTFKDKKKNHKITKFCIFAFWLQPPLHIPLPLSCRFWCRLSFPGALKHAKQPRSLHLKQ